MGFETTPITRPLMNLGISSKLGSRVLGSPADVALSIALYADTTRWQSVQQASRSLTPPPRGLQPPKYAAPLGPAGPCEQPPVVDIGELLALSMRSGPWLLGWATNGATANAVM